MIPRRTNISLSRSFALPARGWGGRLGFPALVFTACWLLVLGYFKPQLLTPARVKLVDGLAPVLESLSHPAELTQSAQMAWREWSDLHAEVQRLRTENARLKGWEQTGGSLIAENESLKRLLNFRAEPNATALTARVIANTGAPYAASMIVTAGSRDGVQKDMAALTEDGLVGRVIEVGEWSARILLLNDPESRVPVMLEGNGARGLIAGDGSQRLTLRYLPAETVQRPGMRFVTSGHGGVLPPHLPVAVIVQDKNGRTGIQPIVDTGRLNYVRLVEYGLAGGDANKLGAGLKNSP